MPMVAWSPCTRTHSSVLLYFRCLGCLRLAINTYLPSFLPFIEWQRYDLRRGTFSSYINEDRFANESMGCFDICHTDVLIERRAGRSTGDNTYLLIIFVNSITT